MLVVSTLVDSHVCYGTHIVYTVFKKQKLSPPTPTPTATTYGISHHHHSAMEWPFHPTDTNMCGSTAASDALTMSNMANNDAPISFFDYNCCVFPNTPERDGAYPIKHEEEETVSLPAGWTLAGRKRSIFELDTNIHTLSELYSTLLDLRNQLPDPVVDQVEELLCKKKPSLSHTRSSTDDYMSIVSKSESSNVPSPPGMLCRRTSSTDTTECEQSTASNDFDRLYWTYPDFIFELLVHVYLDCICFTRVQPDKLVEQHRLHRLDRAYVCAIYATAALHALLCHPERFGIYPFMQQLAKDAYQIAFDLVEFDAMDPTTCETLVVMYQYLLTVGQDGEARNLFCLAQRQMELLLLTKRQKPHPQDVHRLYAWMAELDWSFALAKFTAPLIEYRQLKTSLDHIKPVVTTNYTDDQLYVKAAKFRIRGLHILLSSTSSQHEQEGLSASTTHQHTSSSTATPPTPHHRLNQWRTKYLETFLYKRHAAQDEYDDNGSSDDRSHPTTLYTLEDKLALRLHALYFAGMLELHQQHMLKGFEADQRWESSKEHWPDYFSFSFGGSSSSFEMSTEQSQVEKGLYRSMNAAYGFIQVIRLLLDEKDRCILPQVFRHYCSLLCQDLPTNRVT